MDGLWFCRFRLRRPHNWPGLGPGLAWFGLVDARYVVQLARFNLCGVRTTALQKLLAELAWTFQHAVLRHGRVGRRKEETFPSL